MKFGADFANNSQAPYEKEMPLIPDPIDGPNHAIRDARSEVKSPQPPLDQFHLVEKVDEAIRKSEAVDEGVESSVLDEPLHHVRVNDSFLAVHERNALRWLAVRTPSSVTPDHLTLLGLIGSVIVLVGFVASRISPWFVSLAIFGLFLNWLGDSLDGTLARHRKIERPDFGYFLDHSCDLISQTFIFIGLGLSPYFTLFSALLALSMYLLMTSFTYLKVLILKTHHLSYYGVGATELRLLVAAWAIFAICSGPGLISASFLDVRRIDMIIFGLWSVVFVAFVWKVWSDTKYYRYILDK